jgi:endonuclease YncB( thermonuclease family)
MAATSAQAQSLTGIVVGVSDGDTITLLDQNKQQHKIRVAGIDAPEKKQPFGQRSKEHLSALVFKKLVEVVGDKTDRYGRTVAKVMVARPDCNSPDCPRSEDAGLRQVEAGLAWWYRKYAKEQTREDRVLYETAEATARTRGMGLWSESDPIAPWDWRHPKR